MTSCDNPECGCGGAVKVIGGPVRDDRGRFQAKTQAVPGPVELADVPFPTLAGCVDRAADLEQFTSALIGRLDVLLDRMGKAPDVEPPSYEPALGMVPRLGDLLDLTRRNAYTLEERLCLLDNILGG